MAGVEELFFEYTSTMVSIPVELPNTLVSMNTTKNLVRNQASVSGWAI